MRRIEQYRVPYGTIALEAEGGALVGASFVKDAPLSEDAFFRADAPGEGWEEKGAGPSSRQVSGALAITDALAVRATASVKSARLEKEEYATEADAEERAVLEQAKSELDEYFRGERKAFSVPLSIEGTAFQKAVWGEISKIPYGEVRSYREIAEAAGDPKKARAVGNAAGANPLPFFIPCHRVIASGGGEGGYGGGLLLKRYLFELEGIRLNDALRRRK